MYKHVRVAVRDVGNGEMELVVLEQTHFFEDFGAPKGSEQQFRTLYYHPHIFTHGTCVLYSFPPGEKVWISCNKDETLVRLASDGTVGSSYKFKADRWPEIRAAIEAYNEYFSK